jgi:chlorite dismutase
MSGDEYAGLDWLDDSPKPTKKTLDDAWPQVQHDREHAAVEQARRARYQTETDGMFFAAQREGGDLTAWHAAVNQIKADLAYPEEPK